MTVGRTLVTHMTLFAAILTTGFGCASGPRLDEYPRRELDRPYTLPKGVATWHIPTIYQSVKDGVSSNTFGPFPIPLIWESALSDDWNLIWLPLPLGLRHQISKTEKGRTGIQLLMGFAYTSTGGFRLQPSLSLSHRHRLSEDVAIELTPSASPDVPFESGRNFRWNLGLAVGPLFQLSDDLSIKPEGSIQGAHGGLGGAGGLGEEFSLTRTTVWMGGAGMEAVWSIGRQWDIRPSYHYAGFGSRTGVEAHQAVVDVVHFW